MSDPGPEKITLRLKWRKTWPDRENDFAADSPVGTNPIGRIFIHDTGGMKDGQWAWFYQAMIPGLDWLGLNRSGFEPTARQAAKAIEDIWFKVTEGKVLDASGKRYVKAE